MNGTPRAPETRIAQRLAPNAAMTMIIQARAVEAAVEGRLQDLDLSLRRFGLLGHLRATPGISFSELARRAGIKVQSLQPIIQALIEVGLVRSIGGGGQGRAAVLELTSDGNTRFAEAVDALAQVDADVFADGDWAELGDVLVRIATAAFQREQ